MLLIKLAVSVSDHLLDEVLELGLLLLYLSIPETPIVKVVVLGSRFARL